MKKFILMSVCMTTLLFIGCSSDSSSKSDEDTQKNILKNDDSANSTDDDGSESGKDSGDGEGGTSSENDQQKDDDVIGFDDDSQDSVDDEIVDEDKETPDTSIDDDPNSHNESDMDLTDDEEDLHDDGTAEKDEDFLISDSENDNDPEVDDELPADSDNYNPVEDSDPIVDQDQNESETITISSFNVENLYDAQCDNGLDEFGNCRDGYLVDQATFDSRISEIAASLEKIGADIQILVEMEDETGAEALKNRLPDMFDDYHVANKSLQYTDVGIVTRGKITVIKNHSGSPIQSPDGSTHYFAREFPEIHVKIDGRHVIVFPAHFKSKANDNPSWRLAEAIAAQKIVKETATAYPDAVVVMGGDINDLPGSDPVNALETPEGEEPVLTRVLKDIAVPHEQCTHNYGCWDEEVVCTAIDHLFFSEISAGKYVSGSGKVVKDGACTYYPDDCSQAPYCLGHSDHAAVKASFSFTAPTAAKISDIKKKTIPAGEKVTVRGVVTAIKPDGFYLQMSDAESVDSEDKKYSGIYVYHDTATMDIGYGNRFEVTGTIKNFYDLLEIAEVVEAKKLRENDFIPAPFELSAAEAGTAPYQGTLVTVKRVEVVEIMNQHGEFKVQEGLIVDDFFHHMDPPPAVGEKYDITGIVHYGYGTHRLCPRSYSDIKKLY